MGLTKAQKAARAAAAAAAAKNNSASADDSPSKPAVHDKKIAGEHTRTVYVVCKLPRGLYLQLHQTVKQDVRVVGGGVEKRDVAMRLPERVRLKPARLAFGLIPSYSIECGFSINQVDSDFWRQWMEQNKNFTMLESGLLRGFDDEASAKAYCREYEKQNHGLEPLAQKDDPRVERSTSENVTDVEIDSDSVKAA